jgi:hypothetical protein
MTTMQISPLASIDEGMTAEEIEQALAELVTVRAPSVWESMCLKTLETTGIAMDDIFLPKVIRLRDEYVAVVGGDLKNAIFLSIFEPPMARARITAEVQARLHALADEAAPEPAPSRPRARL